METGWERRNKVYEIDSETVASIFRQFAPKHRVAGVEYLSGGLSNTNYKVHLEGFKDRFVLRIYTREDNNWNKELAIFRLLQDVIPLPHAVFASDDKTIINKNYCILKFIKGETLAQLIHRGYVPGKKLTENIGRKLSLIHQHEYSQTGFLADNVQDVADEQSLDSWIERYAIAPLINGRAGKRLEKDQAKSLIRFLVNIQPIISNSEPACLTHGDFKPTNLLINEDKLAAILDWEFAFAGPFYFDIGQILRYEAELPPGFDDDFITGYKSNCNRLIPPNWKELAQVTDLINLIGFLNVKDERPRLFRDVKVLIDRTLKNWG